MHADLNGYTINNGSVGTVIPKAIGSNKEHMPLAETLRSPLSLQGHPSPGPCSTEGHTHHGSRRTVRGAKGHLLVTAMLISPDLGVSSPSCGSWDMPEVRRGSRLRELSVPKSPSAERLLAGCPRVSLSMSKATLSVHGTLGWGKTQLHITVVNVLRAANLYIE